MYVRVFYNDPDAGYIVETHENAIEVLMDRNGVAVALPKNQLAVYLHQNIINITVQENIRPQQKPEE